MTHDLTLLLHHLLNGYRSRQPQGPKIGVQQPRQNIESDKLQCTRFLVETYNIHIESSFYDINPDNRMRQ